MTKQKQTLKAYQEAKKTAIAEGIRALLSNTQKPRKFKLRGKTMKYITYWSNAHGGEVSIPSDWPVCYFMYDPDKQNIALRYRHGFAVEPRGPASPPYISEMNEWDRREHREKTSRECTHQYSLRQIGEALESLQDRRFNLEKVLYQLSGGKSK